MQTATIRPLHDVLGEYVRLKESETARKALLQIHPCLAESVKSTFSKLEVCPFAFLCLQQFSANFFQELLGDYSALRDRSMQGIHARKGSNTSIPPDSGLAQRQSAARQRSRKNQTPRKLKRKNAHQSSSLAVHITPPQLPPSSAV
jgi:hypothetical protein